MWTRNATRSCSRPGSRALSSPLAGNRQGTKGAVLAVVAGLAALPAYGTDITLPEAVELALRQNPAAVAARERASAAAAQSKVAARAVNRPRLGIVGAWTGTNQAAAVFAQKLDAGHVELSDFAPERLNDPSPQGHLSNALSLEVPLDAFGKAVPARAGAGAMARGADEASREAELEIRLRATAAWHRARLAAQAVEATEKALAGARSRESLLEAQSAEGAALRAEVLRARARRRALESDLASRRGDESSGIAALALAVGSDERLEPAPCSREDREAARQGCAPAADPGELEPWLARAARSPAVRAAEAALDAAAESARGVARESRPDFLLLARLQDDRDSFGEGRASGTAGLYLRWSLFDPQRGARREAAERERAAADADADASLQAASFEIESTWNRARSARERWLAASGGTEEGAEALRVVRERRAAGLATLTDELETEAAAFEAELAELTAATDAAIAHAALERAAGVPATETRP